MPTKAKLDQLISFAEDYLETKLLPFWIKNAPDMAHGGFLTHFDRNGKPTGETVKPFLGQIRMLFTFSSAHRAGYGNGVYAKWAAHAADFLLSHYWDSEHGGWFWIADREGNPINTNKVGYGHCFGMYAFSEYFLATGDIRGKETAQKSYQVVCENMIDTKHGGFLELMHRNWQPVESGKAGGDRKSMDVHMHMMEALTNYYEMTQHPTHKRRLLESMDILTERMCRPDSGTGYIQFAYDFTPLPAIIFDTEWGRDAHPDNGDAHPLDFTSYGHNVEFVWLLMHALDILGHDKTPYLRVVKNMCDHCITYGIDKEFGGVFCEGPDQAPPKSTEKQFWQQGEIMVGMLDAYRLLNKEKYWNAFENVWTFLFTYMVNMEAGGEWFERLDREGNVIDGALAHSWKINYHSVRSIIQVVKRLKLIRDMQ